MDRRTLLTAGALAASGGLVSMLPGSTTTQSEAIRSGPSIFEFGAKGDGRSDDSEAFTKALRFAASHGCAVTVPGFTYAIDRPVEWVSEGDVGQIWGLQCQGARLVSRMTRGQDLVSLRSSNTVRYFRIAGGLTLVGTGRDGNGLRIFAPGNKIYFYNAALEGLAVERVGGHGLLFEGNVFESTILNSYFQDCGKNGATFAHSKGGVCSAIGVIGCFFNQNAAYGLCATNFDGQYGGTTDVRIYGGYCRDNKSYGFYYNNGTGGGALDQVGFENNCRSLPPGHPEGAHVYGLTAMTLRNCTGYNEYGGATYLLRGWFNSLTVLDGCGQAAGGAVLATGKSRLVQVNGSATGHVLMRQCGGGVDVVPGTACTWQAMNCSGPSPRGPLDVRSTIYGT